MSPRSQVARTTSAAETQAMAAAIADLCRPGDVVVLAGEMGAGKTAFAQGFARGLGITDRVTSPTFTIVREYSGPGLALHHLDVYRLEHMREVLELGIGEMLDEDAVMLVEWGDAVLPALGDLYLEIRAGTGGDEAAIFAGDLFRMYLRYAEGRRWHVEILSAHEGEHGGYKEVVARVEGKGKHRVDPGFGERHGPGGLRHWRARGRAGLLALIAGEATRREPHSGHRVHLSPSSDRAERNLVRGCR